jgi:hypothetical protein
MLRSLLHSLFESNLGINLYSTGPSANREGFITYLTVGANTIRPHLKSNIASKIAKKQELFIVLYSVFRNKKTAQKAAADVASVLAPLNLKYTINFVEIGPGEELLQGFSSIGHSSNKLRYDELFLFLKDESLALITAQGDMLGTALGNYQETHIILVVINNRFYAFYPIFSNLSTQYQTNIQKFLRLVRITNYQILRYSTFTYRKHVDPLDFNSFIQKHLPGTTQTSDDLKRDTLGELFDIIKRQFPCFYYDPSALVLTGQEPAFAHCKTSNGVTYLMGAYPKDSPAEASARVIFPELLKILGFSGHTPITWEYDFSQLKNILAASPIRLNNPWDLSHQLLYLEF